MHTPGDGPVPVDTVPGDTVPGDTVPGDTVPTDTGALDTGADDSDESRVEVYVTTDTSAAPHKADEPRLYVMYNAAKPDRDRLSFPAAECAAFVVGVTD